MRYAVCEVIYFQILHFMKLQDCCLLHWNKLDLFCAISFISSLRCSLTYVIPQKIVSTVVFYLHYKYLNFRIISVYQICDP